MSTQATGNRDFLKAFAYRDLDTAAPNTELGRAFIALKAEHPEAAAVLNSTPGASTPSVPPELAAKARDLLQRVGKGELKLQTDRYGHPISPFLSASVDRAAIDQLTRLAATAKGGAVVAGAMARRRADREIPEFSMALFAGLVSPMVLPVGFGLAMFLHDYHVKQLMLAKPPHTSG